VTIERQTTAVLVGGTAANFDTCPLCGQKLAPSEHATSVCRLEGSVSLEAGPDDGTKPGG
jgi:hypothetical protein